MKIGYEDGRVDVHRPTVGGRDTAFADDAPLALMIDSIANNLASDQDGLRAEYFHLSADLR